MHPGVNRLSPPFRLQRWCRARGTLFAFGQTDIVTQPGPTPNPHLILLADAPWFKFTCLAATACLPHFVTCCTEHLRTFLTPTDVKLLAPCDALSWPRAGASARAQKKVALQSEVMPEVKRSKRSNEDAVFPMNKRNAQRDVTRAAKQIVQEDAVFPTSNAERMKESYEPSSEAHGGSREHAGRPRELSRGQRDYENMVAVATKQSEAYAQRFERIDRLSVGIDLFTQLHR